MTVRSCSCRLSPTHSGNYYPWREPLQVTADLVGWAGVGFGGRGGSAKLGDGFAQGEQFGDLSLKVCPAESEEVAYVFPW